MRTFVRRALFLSFLALASPAVATRGMTVDEIVAVATFADADGAGAQVSISPDGKFLLAIQEQATPDRKMLQADILLWKKADLDRSAEKKSAAPLPIRLATFASVNGPVVISLKWSQDSRSIAVLVTEGKGSSALWRVALSGGKQKVSLPAQNVRSFDVAASTIVYTASAASPIDGNTQDPGGGLALARVGTGKALQDLLFPNDNPDPSQWVDLWRWSGGRPSRVAVTGAIRLSEDRNPLTLSPDGKTVIVDFPVDRVPEDWSRFSADTRLDVTASWVSGPQRFTNTNGFIPHQFQILDLGAGIATPVVDAPDAVSRGFLLPSAPLATWSSDGSHVALSATFLPGRPKPCVAVMEMATRVATCVTPVENAFDRIRKVEFVGGAPGQVRLDIERAGANRAVEIFEFDRAASAWKRASKLPSGSEEKEQFYVRQDMNNPPVLVARQQRGDVTIFDPNLKMDRSRLASWETVTIPVPDGPSIKAGLLVPDGPVPATGFPLVIQTHGFNPTVFSPSGIYEAPYAAQAFVKEGFAVLQVPISCPIGEGDEIPCSLKHYRSAISFLSTKGIVDPKNLAIIGFSRTGIHVLAALTDPTFSFKAAVLQNGYLNTITQYFGSVGYASNFVNGWMSKMIGGKPYGKGLSNWMSVSPSFKYDRLDTPLRVEANGKFDTLFMWEPYAAMRDRGMPTDFIMMRQGTHPLSNPAERAASQQGAVDWFAYWLKGQKDPSPNKRAQYERWDMMKSNIAKK